MNTYRARLQMTFILILGATILISFNSALADVGIGLSNIFSLDTREDLPPDGNWQILTSKGNSYSEDVIIDAHGKVWAFYLRSPGSGQPVYMKILRPDGYVYKSETVVGNATALQSGKYQTVRACLNTKTGDVWVAIQGSENGVSKGYFVVYDSTGNVRFDRTFLNSSYSSGTGSYYPKMACDQNGYVWFVWQTDSTGSSGTKSAAEFASYTSQGTSFISPKLISTLGSVSGLDLTVDSMNRIWFLIERGNNSIFRKIIESDDVGTLYKDEYLVASNINVPFGAHRVLKADFINHRVWILAKNADALQQRVFIYDLDGDPQASVYDIGEAAFSPNELNRLEVVQFSNGKYRKSEYNPTTGTVESDWMDLFNDVHSFVHNGVMYTPDYDLLKVYLVQTDSITTKFYLEHIERTPSIYVNPQIVQFDSVLINATKQMQVQVSNEGTAQLTVSSVESDESQFSVDVSQFTLAPGARRTLTITFRPVIYDTIRGTLTIMSNDPDAPETLIQMVGVGRRQKDQKIAVSPSALDFGIIALDSFDELPVTIKNSGEKNLYVDSIRVDDSQYTVSADTMVIAPGKERIVQVTFAPTIVDTVRATIAVHNDDLTNPAPKVSLVGIGREKTPPAISVQPNATVDFGRIQLGNSSRKIFTITNSGEQTLAITDISSSNDQFEPDTSQLSVASGRTVELGVTFSPTVAGKSDAELTIASNDPDTPSVIRNMTGEGVKVEEQDIFVSADSLYFGGVKIGESRTRYFWVKNVGELILNVSQIQSHDAQFTVNPSSFSLEPQQFKYVYVTFTPQNLGTVNGSLTIYSDDPDSGELNLGLVGRGEEVNPAQISVNRQNIDFGEIVVGSTRDEMLWIYNPGDLALVVSNIYTSNSNFTVNSTNFELSGNTGKWITVTFQPQSVDTYDANLTIISNDEIQGTLNIPLNGSSREPNNAQISVIPSSVNFGTIPYGDSTTSYIYVKNIGEQELAVSNMQETDTQFSADIHSINLTAGQYKRVNLKYIASKVGTMQASLIITSNSDSNATLAVPVTGTGKELRQPELWVSNSGSVWNFGKVALESQSRVYYQVSNLGEQDLVVYDMKIDDSQFSTVTTGGTLGPGESWYRYVYFRPTQLDTSRATLTIRSNDKTMEITLQGIGRERYAPDISPNPEALAFGQIPIGTRANLHLWIRNAGERELTVSNITSGNTRFTVNQTAFIVPGNSQQLVIVSFTPTDYTKVQAELQISSNDPDESIIQVPVSGSGRDLYRQKLYSSPSQLNFGSVGIQKEKQLPLWIQNTGEIALTIHSILANDIRYLVNESGFTLEPSAGRYIYVTFAPTTEDTVRAELTISSNDPEVPIKEISLFGFGRRVIPQTLVVSPENINFGQVGEGLTTSQQILLSNQGEESLQVSNIATTDAHFTASPSTAFTILPGADRYVQLAFSPTSVDTFRGEAVITSNDEAQETVRIPLIGVGRVRSNPKVSVSTRHLKFDSVAVGREQWKYLYIQNIGEMPLTIYDISSNNDQFEISSKSYQLEPNATMSLSVFFRPIMVGEITGQLAITNNDPDSSRLIVSVSGVGRDLKQQQITVYPGSLEFSSVNIGQSSTRYLSVRNDGDELLEVRSISSSDSQFAVGTTTFTVQAGMEQRVAVTFTPVSEGEANGALVLYNNDSNHSAYQIPVSGTGHTLTAQHIMVSPDSLIFGEIPVNTTVSANLFISNLGEDSLIVTNIVSSDSQFSVSDTSLVVPAYGSKLITVSFHPVQKDTFNARLTIFSNDPLNDSVEIGMLGIGRDFTPQQISIRQESIDFGSIGWGRTGSTSLIISNIGETILKINSISNSNSLFTAMHPQTTFNINPGSGQVVLLYFQPTPSTADSTNESFSSTLTIQSDDPKNREVEISLAGEGRKLNPSDISVSHPEIDFGSTAIKRKVKQNFYVKNDGEKTLSVSNIKIASSGSADQFTISPIKLTVASSDSKLVSITYAPTRIAAIDTIMQIISNDPDSATYEVPIHAKSVEYNGSLILVQPDTLNFGTIVTGSRRINTLTVSNDGHLTLNVNNIYTTYGSAFSASPNTLKIVSGGSAPVEVIFHPIQHGTHFGQLQLLSDDEYSSVTTVVLRGTAIPDTSGNFQLGDSWTYASAPFGANLGTNSTSSVLGTGQSRCWFIRDFDLYHSPQSAIMRITYNEGAYVFINGILAFDWSGDSWQMWNWRPSENILPYLNLGRNRIAVQIFNQQDTGGFDCEVQIDGSSIIAAGNDNWDSPDAYWWYYWAGSSAPPPAATDSKSSWFSSLYGWSQLDSLVAGWSFERISGDTIYDASMYGRRAVIQGATLVDGIKGKALRFNGLSDHADLEVNVNNTPLTVDLWLKCMGTTGGSQTIFSNKSANGAFGHGLYLSNTLSLVVLYFDNTFPIPDFQLALDNWYFISTRFLSDSIYVYVNGEVRAQFFYNRELPDGLSHTYLGRTVYTGAQVDPFNGIIDEIMIYNINRRSTSVPNVATIALTQATTAKTRSKKTLQFRIEPANARINSGKFKYAPGGSSVFKEQIIAESSDSTLTLEIPADAVTVRGVQYRLDLQSNLGKIQYPVGNDTTSLAWLTVSTAGEVAPFKSYGEIYRMISVPYNLNDKSVEKVLVDDFKRYDEYNWRLFKWYSLAGMYNYGRYTEMKPEESASSELFARGEAAWLVSWEPNITIDADSGYSASSSDSFEIVLPTGWSQIGNPFPFHVAWSSVKKDTTFISNLYYYNPKDQGYELNSPVMKPWEGYFVNNSAQPMKILIPAKEYIPGVAKEISSGPTSIMSEFEEVQLACTIDARCGKVTDKDNLLAVAAGASNVRDSYDACEPPPIGFYVRLRVDNSDWKTMPGDYAIDVRAAGERGYIWNLIADGAITKFDETVELKFKQTVELPEDQEMFLFDLADEIAINLKTVDHYEFSVTPGESFVRRFKAIAGDEEFIKENCDGIPLQPLKFELAQNYPNPFNPVTKILFSLPKKSHTTLLVYNILGQHVKTLVDGELRAARHAIIWDGTNDLGKPVASGVYLVRLRSEGKVQVRKMTLLK
ncbi:choice-of-anchor D domain-containing protein [candidate division KSB1 bacterium]|nr:choice-of-anchor D domain-containing protein [candidate division KSB1 bacterium]